MTNPPYREHRIEANSLTHYVQDWGDEKAPAAILLHGWPDSSALWRHVAPTLTAGGYRIIIPDLRGYGQTDAPEKPSAYKIPTDIASDVTEILSKLNIEKAHLVGHDFGAMAAWFFAAHMSEQFKSLSAISVGHPDAYMNAGFMQKLRGAYILLHNMTGFCEGLYRFANWRFFRLFLSSHKDIDLVISDLSRPGRLTACLNWYRANLSTDRFFSFLKNRKSNAQEPLERKNPVSLPTMGVWGDKDFALVENQMTDTAPYINGPWRFERLEGTGHWIPLDNPEKLAALLLDHWGKVDQDAY